MSLFLDSVFDMESTVNPEKILLGLCTRMASLQVGGKRLRDCWAGLPLSHDYKHLALAAFVARSLHSP